MAQSARQIADVFESIAPLSLGNTGDQLGFIYGDPETEVRGVACMWNAHSASISQAVERDLNLLIVHEGIFYGPQKSPWYDGPDEDAIIPNQRRIELLDRHDLVVYRSHSNWDALPVDGVPDRAVNALAIDGLRVIAEQKYFKVHELPAPMAASEIAARAKRGLDLPWVRTFGDMDREIRRLAFLIGGFGENQTHMPQAAVELGAELIVIGEMNEFVVIAALECGACVIETLHSASEIPAIRRQAEMLDERLPEIPVQYIDSGCLGFSSDDQNG